MANSVKPKGNSVRNTGRSGLPGPTPDPNAGNAKYVEFGATGLRNFAGYIREEWLRDLLGWKGRRVLREMRDNDEVVGAFFFAIEMLLRGVTFHIEGSSDEPEDQAAADFSNSCIADLEHTWPDLIGEVMTFLYFGWDVHEIVYKVRQGSTSDPKTNSKYNDGLIGWRKFAVRAQETLLHWEFNEAGDATAMIQLLPTGGPLLRVPLAKALHFRTTTQKSNPEGRSLLRNAYRSWYFKKRIQEVEAIGVERDLAGMPIAWVPASMLKSDATEADKSLLEMFKSMVRDTARNEQEGFVLPQEWQEFPNGGAPQPMFKMELLSTGGRRQFDTSGIINRYDQRIASVVLADFITLGGSSSHGSYAMSRNKTDMFSIAVIGFLDIIVEQFNRKALPDLLAVNGMPGSATMRHGDIARRDLTELAAYVQQLAMVGFLTPDETTEDHLREEASLPALGQDSMREAGRDDSDENQVADTDVTDSVVDPRGNADAQGQGAGASAADRYTGRAVP